MGIDLTSDNDGRTESKDVRHWINEISAAKRREKDFRREGERINSIYDGKEREKIPFNILFSNTETLVPAVYSMVPRPVVERRFKDEDATGKAAAVAAQRMLSFLLDTNIDGYETFDNGMKAAVQNAALPGRGVTAVKYDADVVDVEEDAEDDEDSSDSDGGFEIEATPYMQSELVCLDSIQWDRVWFGYARTWSKVPWVAYETHLDREECEKLFGHEKAAKIAYTTGEEREDDADDFHSADDDEQNIGERKTALIYQIWDKAGGRRVRYVSPQFKDDFLADEPDPLGLTGFFNCPKPLQFVEGATDMIPIALYSLYEQQAKELNNLSRRIINVIDAIKAKGIYDSSLGEDIQNILQACENELVPADKGSSLAAEKGMQNAIWFWPVEKLIVVLQQLYVAREACKKVIYEITGIADIMRGSSNASETLGAQEIKQQWGTLRLKRLQKEVQRYARDLLRMMLEVAAQKFSIETWAKMTGLPFVTADQRSQASQMAQIMQQQATQQAQMAQAQGMQPPPPPRPDPQMQFALDAPVWEEVLELLRDDIQRAYRIDIETNTTIEAEATEDQKQIAEVMNALAQYLNGVSPLVMSGALPFEASQGMMMAIVRRFRFGPEIEDYIKKMQPPQPKDDGKGAAEAAKMQAEAQKLQDMQKALQAETKAAQDSIVQQQADAQRSIDDAKRDAEAELQRQSQSLEMERAQFEFDKELARKELEYQDKLSQIKAEAMAETMKSELNNALESHKRDVQSHLDKHAARVERANTKGVQSANV
jgi:hypothetical protein